MSDSIFLPPGRGLQAESGDWYKVVQTLGAGGNAVTFLVLATSGPFKGVLFALKIFRRLSKPERRTAFLREAAFLRDEGGHPSIMETFDEGVFRYTVEGVTSDYPFLVAEYLPRTLEHVIRADNVSTVERLSYAIQLLSALRSLSSLSPPVVHRDVKPQNIFVKARSCVLGDFGLMKVLDGNDDADRDIFKESVGPGMPFFYRTPDLVSYARGQAALTAKSDVFQLGLVLTHLFTGRNPLVAPRNGDHFSPIEMEDIGDIRGDLSGGIVTLLRRMLTVNPQARPSAEELMDPWMGVFQDAATRMHSLEGQIFP